MRILAACSLGGAGHFNPLVAFLHAAQSRGDEILTVGPPALRAMVESAGFPFRPGGEPSEEHVAAIRERLPVAPAAEASVLGNRELFGRLATAAMLPGMEDAWEDWVPDLVLRDPTEYASAVLAARTRTPIAQVAISLAQAEAGSIAAAAPALHEHRQGLALELRAQPYLTRFPASFDPSPFAETLRYHERRATTPVSLPDWWSGSDAPLIYMTFGTVLGYMSIAAETYRLALEGVKRTHARVLLTVGRRFDAGTLGPVPANVHVEPWIDQARVLDHADLVVCHGGSGTTLAALAASLPLVMVPLFADQFENARRIAKTGAGRIVETHISASGARFTNKAAVAGITASIEDLLEDVSPRARARAIAAEMAVTATADEVLTRFAERASVNSIRGRRESSPRA
jgi:UDP:flavonoid glycosyltransferase YjiC (YdhE family)